MSKKALLCRTEGNQDLSWFASTVVPEIEKFLYDPSITFLISDEAGFSRKVQRFLVQKGIRSVIIYHLGEEPDMNIGGYATCGGYVTMAELYLAIKYDASSIHYFDS